MAVKLKQETLYTKKPDLNTLKEIGKDVNSIPLPNIPDNPQILLPPPEHSLIRNNFQLYSEDILHNLTNQNVKKQDTSLEEEFGLTKRHSIIGLKRRDYDDRQNVMLKKKKLRLSANDEDMSFKKVDNRANHSEAHKKMMTHSYSGQSNNIQSHHNIASHTKHANKPADDDLDGDLFEQEEDNSASANNNNPFYTNNENQSDMDDFNYYDNF